MHVSRTTYLLFLGGAVLWCAAIVAAPALVAAGGAWLPMGKFLYQLFHPICHQLDNRSLHCFGGPMAACSRCSAIYFAFLGGTLLYPLVRSLRNNTLPPRALLFAGLLPLMIDGIAGGGMLYHATMVTRLVTGAVAGAVLPFFVLPAAIEGFGQLLNTKVHPLIEQPQKGLRDA